MDNGFEFDYQNLETGILATLAFFGLYQVPLPAEKIFSCLYKSRGSPGQVKAALEKLVAEKKVYFKAGLYALKPWAPDIHETHLREIDKRRKKVKNFLWLLALVPFVREMSLINSLTIGNCGPESDIDFFVVTAKGRLYFTRSLMIVLLKLFGLYKTRTKIRERFCFGYHVSSADLSLEKTLIGKEDPLLAFWLASMQPLFGKQNYLRLIESNQWLFDSLPNFLPSEHYYGLVKKPRTLWLRPVLEVILFLPALILEPVLRYIHIRHTFHLPENSWPSSTTVANAQMLKLHAIDPRKQIRANFYSSLAQAVSLV